MMMKLSKMAWVCMILVMVVWPFRISGMELSSPQPPMLIEQSVGRGQEKFIRGPKAMCIDVPASNYRDGWEVYLWECGSNRQHLNQLWTFGDDGTIRPHNNNFCLMPRNGCPESPPNYLMISRCPNNPRGTSAQWRYDGSSDGYLVHMQSGLVLTAKGDVQGHRGTLTVDVDQGLPGQGWVLDDGPSIQRLQSGAAVGRCLTASNDNSPVGLGSCATSSRNTWEILAFSTVANNGKCLSCQDSNGRATPCRNGSLIVARDCCVASANQRWVIRNNRFINPESGLYLTVASGDRVIAAPLAGPDSRPALQTWTLL